MIQRIRPEGSERAEESDEILMSRYKGEGNQEAFAQLLDRYQAELLRYLTKYTGSSELGADILQNTFMQILLKKHLYKDGALVRPWLYSIATHQAIDVLRKIGKHPTVSLDQPIKSEFMDPLVVEEQKDCVRTAIADLSPVLREVVVLAYFQNFKYREISDRLKVPIGTVKSRLHAALLKLREERRLLFGENEVPQT